ncbi:hypothetical protein MUK42_26069 [Musa troglodytarum]|uniref:DUF620 family protein n=1 Tax=Musa troglodytarum TaxID=320322 RepID=A0A9E7J9V1_9LILI|nr:hypothetical protein MUK42_26069 [Musa troglodytarum]
MARLAPLSEEPISEEESRSTARRIHSFHNWIKSHLPMLSNKRNDLKILLSVLGCPLSPLSVSPKQPRDVASSAQYIIQQFRATTGCSKRERTAKSMYASGRVRMEMAQEHGVSSSGSASKGHHKGCFVVWQMVPDMWLVEFAVSGHQIAAGSDGKVAWRRTPWLRAHAARGGVRPLRRALQATLHCHCHRGRTCSVFSHIAINTCIESLHSCSLLDADRVRQGLDPETIAAVFSPAQHIGEKHIGDEECFVLELVVDNSVLSSWSDSTAEIIKHRMLGFFSQRSGLLVRLEDSQLTRIQSPGAEAMYWETTMVSCMEDYRRVDGLMIAHSGRSVASLLRFGLGVREHRVSTQMEERWTIDDVLFDVPGLAADCFIPPEEVRRSCFYDIAIGDH